MVCNDERRNENVYKKTGSHQSTPVLIVLIYISKISTFITLWFYFQVLHIAKELSATYGVIICIFILQYLSRVITQFYDLIDKDAQRFCAWTNAWNVIIRIVSILPVFVCCERLKRNVGVKALLLTHFFSSAVIFKFVD